ncbi:MAG: hypothetical protein AB9897_01225 [Anaerolineaceae bacterium]
MKKLLFVFLISLVLLTGCSTDCNKKEVQSATDQLNGVVQKWDDMVNIAGSTPRIALSNVITDLQDIKNEANAVEIPACVTEAKTDLLRSMTNTIEGLVLFMGEGSESDIHVKFSSAGSLRSYYEEEIYNVNQCAPNCATPTP